MSRWKAFLVRIDLLVHSIRFRLVLWFVLILALVLLAFSALLFFTRVQEMRAETVNRLESKLEQVEGLFRMGAPVSLGGDIGVDNIPLDPQDVFALYNADSTLAFVSGPFKDLPGLQLSHAEGEPRDPAIEYRTVSPAGPGQYAFLVAPMSAGRGPFIGYLVIGTPVDPRGELGRLIPTLLLLIGLMLLVAFAGGFWLADRAMRPVKTIASQARNIGESDLSQRFDLTRKDEIGQLAAAFDSMLARLEAAFSRQRQFTADASHELRTPLTIVNLEASHALAAPRPPREYRRALEVIRSENERMTHLVNDLLTLARMDAGRELLHKEPLDLSDLVLEVVERLEPLASRESVELATGDLPDVAVLGDRQALARLLSNLVENAIKYTAQNPPGKAMQVLVETGVSPGQSCAWARVTDTGPGIPNEHLTHLFDRFYRADKSRARAAASPEESSFPGSSGLGLAIVDGIARLHGGRVEVQSKDGQGTVFELSLPLRRGPGESATA